MPVTGQASQNFLPVLKHPTKLFQITVVFFLRGVINNLNEKLDLFDSHSKIRKLVKIFCTK